ncbi:MAG: rhodanese-like domain-containing protein [Chloroflexales bacterium]|nr:rhodanese-like domain-containing protein [Chloroflexales bacterium]
MGRIFRAIAAPLLAALAIAMLSACGGAAPAAAPTTAPTAPTTAPAAVEPFTNISVQDLKSALDSGEKLLLLDVRTPEEYTGDGHVAGSLLIPVDQVQARLGELPKDTPIVCICRSGNRSRVACETLAANGYAGLRNVEGGMRAWASAGYPIEH